MLQILFSLEIKPKDCSDRMENSSRQTENSPYLFPLRFAKILFKISSSLIKLIFLFVKTRILNQDQSFISLDKDTFVNLFCGWYYSQISVTTDIFTSWLQTCKKKKFFPDKQKSIQQIAKSQKCWNIQNYSSFWAKNSNIVMFRTGRLM